MHEWRMQRVDFQADEKGTSERTTKGWERVKERGSPSFPRAYLWFIFQLDCTSFHPPVLQPALWHYGARGNEVATRRFQGSRTGVRLIPPVTSVGKQGGGGWGVEKPDRRRGRGCKVEGGNCRQEEVESEDEKRNRRREKESRKKGWRRQASRVGPQRFARKARGWLCSRRGVGNVSLG